MTAPSGISSLPGTWTWTDDKHLEVAGERFLAAPYAGRDDAHLVIKTPALVQRYLDLVEAERPARIVELGAKEGGSTALLALVTDPDLLISVDLAPEVPPRLASVIERHGFEGRLVPRFGLDQGDRAALAAAIDELLGDEPLDLVIDDASHILGPTRASMDVLLPRLRTGGLYVVEDWTSENLTAEELSRLVPPTSPDFAERLALSRGLLHALNSPTVELPAPAVAALTAAAREDTGGGDGEDSDLSRFFRLVVRCAAGADLTQLRTLAEVVPDAPRPLSDLAVELTMLAAGRSGIVTDVSLDEDWIVARRGPAALPRDGFRLDDVRRDHFGYLT